MSLGDPRQITIWGESAGAGSVGFHLNAYGGRDDKIFRAAVMESGNPTYTSRTGLESSQATYDQISIQAGCANSTNSLQCLRGITAESLNTIINGTAVKLTRFSPTIDGDIIQQNISTQLRDGKFVHVPIISGGECWTIRLGLYFFTAKVK
jgi:carboxylesterase type B